MLVIHQIMSFNYRLVIYYLTFVQYFFLILFLVKELNSDKVEELHSDFQNLAEEILKPGNSYILKTANRIYGEKTYPFHNVSVDVFLFINKNRSSKQEPAIKYTFL